MKVLLLAPHPFYQERGTPIAVNLLARALIENGNTVDILTYHEGSNAPPANNAAIHRIRNLRFIHGIKPGFSLKKIICDCFMLPQAMRLAKKNRYDIVHAVEESVFMAMSIRTHYGIPYVYDMDSSMPRQIAENSKLFAPLLPLMKCFEKKAVRKALAIVPVCDTLADLAKQYGATKIAVLRDISLIDKTIPVNHNLKQELGIKGFCFLYLGNLEPYQGIDLLMQSFSILQNKVQNMELVIAGGTQPDIDKYRETAKSLKIQNNTHFIGPRPVSEMMSLFEMTDVLVSPRTRGGNTPMKIYSYLDSGKPILATDLTTHTQVLNNETAVLTAAQPEQFAQSMERLASNPALRLSLAQNAGKLARGKYSLETYRQTVTELYNWLGTHIQPMP